jgi:hypothetical protein
MGDSFTPWLLNQEYFLYALNGRLEAIQSWSGCSGEERVFCLLGIEPQIAHER